MAIDRRRHDRQRVRRVAGDRGRRRWVPSVCVMDASGNYSKMAEAITLARIEQAGVVPIDTIALCAELQKTWNCQDAAQWTELYAASINRVHRNTEHVSRAALSQDIAGLRATGLELAP